MHDIVINLNEIVFLPVVSADTAILVRSDLYNIESNNSIEVRSQSVSTDNGNEHTIIKTANESVIGTKIPAGELAIFATNTSDVNQVPGILARAILLP